jgi:hypothetical protein
MTLAARIFVARARATSRKAARKRRAELERELAGYASPAERRDLEAALDRYPGGTTHELRSILARQSMAANEMRFPAIGRNLDQVASNRRGLP